MPNYCTIQDLVDLFGTIEITELSNLEDPGASSINRVRVQKAIVAAEAEINSYLQGRYALPLASVPVVLVNKAADIVRYYLDSTRPREDVRLRYEDAIRWLRLVASGQVDLGLTAAGALTPESGGSPQYVAPDRVFTAKSLEGF